MTIATVTTNRTNKSLLLELLPVIAPIDSYENKVITAICLSEATRINLRESVEKYMQKTYVKYVELYGILDTDTPNALQRKVNALFKRVARDTTATTDKYWLCNCDSITIHGNTEYECSVCGTGRMSGTDATILQAIGYNY